MTITTIDIAVADKERALVVPAGALRDVASPEPSVLVIRNGVATRTGVATGARTAEHVEILAGLEAGTKVVVDPAVVAGDRVRER